MPLSAEDEARVRKHSFHVKFDHQLDAMLVSHTSKLGRLRESGGDLDKYTQDADGMAGVRWDLKQQLPELSIAELDQEFFDQQVYYIWKSPAAVFHIGFPCMLVIVLPDPASAPL